MSAFFVVPYGEDSRKALGDAVPVPTLKLAKEVCDLAAKEHGKPFVVVELETVWSTKTLDDLEAEHAAAA